jgi:hypothetical protein
MPFTATMSASYEALLYQNGLPPWACWCRRSPTIKGALLKKAGRNQSVILYASIGASAPEPFRKHSYHLKTLLVDSIEYVDGSVLDKRRASFVLLVLSKRIVLLLTRPAGLSAKFLVRKCYRIRATVSWRGAAIYRFGQRKMPEPPRQLPGILRAKQFYNASRFIRASIVTWRETWLQQIRIDRVRLSCGPPTKDRPPPKFGPNSSESEEAPG